MKNSKLVVGLSSLLKVDVGVIETALLDEAGDDSLLKDFLSKNNVFSSEDISRMKANVKIEAISELEKASEFPSAIYNRVKGFALDKTEKEIGKKYGIERWDNMEDLISKISTKGKGVDGDKEKQIELLKKSLKDAELFTEAKVKEIESKYTNDFLTRDFKTATEMLKLDGGDDATIDNQKKLINGAFLNTHKLAYHNEKTVVLDSEGKTVVNKTGDAMDVFDVYKNFAVNHGAKIKEIDAGGRGDGSSKADTTNNLKGKTLNDVFSSKGITNPNSKEGTEIFNEWSLANKN